MNRFRKIYIILGIFLIPNISFATIDLIDSSDTGSSNTDNITQDYTPSFLVSCSTAGTTINLYSSLPTANTYLGQGTCPNSGSTYTWVTYNGCLDFSPSSPPPEENCHSGAVGNIERNSSSACDYICTQNSTTSDITITSSISLISGVHTISRSDNSNDTLSVTIEAYPISASNNSVSIAHGTAGTVNIFSNDRLNNTVVTANTVNVVLNGDSIAGISVSNNGLLTIPSSAPVGSYTQPYTICEKANTSNCASANIIITITAKPISASNDSVSTVHGTAGTVNIISNDRLNNTSVSASALNISLTGTPVISGSSVNTSGVFTVPATASVGTYTQPYQICEKANTSNCVSANIVVTVTAKPISANDDALGTVHGTAGTVNIISNDTLNSVSVSADDVNISLTGTPVISGSSVSTSGVLTVPDTASVGTYTQPYQICEKVNTSNCASANIAITITAKPISADNDQISMTSGTESSLNVLEGDTFNNAAATSSTVSISLTGSILSFVSIQSDGTMTLSEETPAGTHTQKYTICEKALTNNCSTATVTINVETTPILAQDDTITARQGYTGAVNILSNDTLNNTDAELSKVNLSLVNPLSEDGEIRSDGSYYISGDFSVGEYTQEYKLCQKSDPDNCTNADIKIIIEKKEIEAKDDSGSTKAGSSLKIDLIDNDLFDEKSVDIDDITIEFVNSSSDDFEIDEDTGKLKVSKDAPAGNYNKKYKICEKAYPDNCSTAYVSIEIIPKSGRGGSGTRSEPKVDNPKDDDADDEVDEKLGEEIWRDSFSVNQIDKIIEDSIKDEILDLHCDPLIKNLDELRMKKIFYDTFIHNSSEEYVNNYITWGQFERTLKTYADLTEKKPDISSLFEEEETPMNSFVKRGFAMEIFVRLTQMLHADSFFATMPVIEEIVTFADVSTRNHMSPYIQKAYNICLIHGRHTRDGLPVDENGNIDSSAPRVFEPNSYITIAETIKVLINMSDNWDKIDILTGE